MKPLSRRRAREIALQVLYSIDANTDVDPTAALGFYFDRFAAEEREDQPDDDAGPADRSFAETLVREVSTHRAEIDEVLGQLSRNWRVERIARVERTILRMALYELKFRDDIPARVTINEAIELAKRFGTAESPAFENGLLDRISQELARS